MIDFEYETKKGGKLWHNGGPWRIEQELPWLTQGSVVFIENHIEKSHKVLEFGSGGSTLFFARRAEKVISFESGGRNTPVRVYEWYKMLVDKLQESNIKNVELCLLQSYPKSDRLYNYMFNSLPNEYFNWLLVDGIHRVLCIKQSRDKLVSGGYMIIDNYAGDYHRTKELLSDWKVFRFDCKTWNGRGTIILQKP